MRKRTIPKPLRNGLILLAIITFIAVLGPSLAPFALDDFNDDMLHPPSSTYLFGTDGIGRDVLSMVLYGARTSLLVGIIAAMISVLIGITLGAISGYYGGFLDRVLNELIHIFLMLPTFFLIIMVIALFGSSIWNVTIVIGLTSWMGTAKIMNAQVKTLKERTYVKAARVIGESDGAILWKYIVPHGIFPVLANVSMSISSAILYEASLSFLGLGDPQMMSWGQIIYIGKQYMGRGWWVATFAGLAIVLTMFSFHQIGEGITIALDPKRQVAR